MKIGPTFVFRKVRMITAKEIDKKLIEAIKRFGTYHYEDKRSHEIMDLNPILESFKGSNDPAAVLEVLETLDKKKRNEILVSDLVSSLDDWDELFDNPQFAEHELLRKYY